MPGIDYTIGAKTSGFTAGIQDAQGKLRGLGKAFAAITGTGLAAGLLMAGKASLSLASSQQQLSIAFGTMLGSGSKAAALLAEIQSLGASTPYQYEELAKAGKSLLAFGIGADKITSTLRRLGDIAIALGIPMNDIAEIYGKARVQGRLFAEDINQLTGRGIPIIAALAKQFGVAEGDVRQLVESGKVGFKDLEAAFATLTSQGGQFFGMMASQSQSVEGKLSTLKDELSAIGRTIGEEVLPFVSNSISTLTAVLQELKDFGPGDFSLDRARQRYLGNDPFAVSPPGKERSELTAPESEIQRNERLWRDNPMAKLQAKLEAADAAKGPASYLGSPVLQKAMELYPRVLDELKNRSAGQVNTAVSGMFDAFLKPAPPPVEAPTAPPPEIPDPATARATSADRLRQIGGYVGGGLSATKDRVAEKTEQWTRKSSESLAKIAAAVTRTPGPDAGAGLFV